MIGIFGVGGIGKTTIAKEMYNRITDQFEGSCFLANVRESSKENQGGLVKFQETILFEILKDSSLKVSNVDRGINLITEKLRRKRILLVLDDVDCLDQLKKLCGGCNWFGSGSRIIITTRDEGLLTRHSVYFNYRMKEMDHDEALQLFSQHAFKSDKPDDAFADVIELALKCADGLPLALQVIGSHLYRQDIDFWKSELEKYNRIPEESIYNKLKISYDRLDYYTKKIFLDIACFFKGDDKDYVTKILNGCGFFANSGIKMLNDKCLITINEYDQLMMHDLLEDMGKEIVRQESPDERGKRSRLFFHEDVREVLEKNKGTEQIEGILINPTWKDNCKIRLDSDVFAKMEKLRILEVRGFNHIFCGGLDYLSNELRVLHWPDCPLLSLPSNFHGEKLIVFNIGGSKIRNLGTRLQSKNLRSIDLSFCVDLTNIPDLSSCSNLEELMFVECVSLVEVDNSVGVLDKLVQLDFSNCFSLKKLPRSFKLRSLELLDLSCCRRLEYFPEIECEMEHVKDLSLESTVIQELPSSITSLTGLEKLSMYECINLVHFPINLFQLEHLRDVSIINCPNFVNFGKEVGHNGQFVPCTQENEISSSMELLSSSLRILNLSGSGIVRLPPCIEGSVGLFKLDLRDCKQLEEILRLPLNIVEVDVRGCSSLKSFLPESNNNLSRLRILNLSGSGIVRLPPCIEGSVGLSKLDLRDCKQLEEILRLPLNIRNVDVRGCSSLKTFLPESNNNLSRLEILNLSGSGIVRLPPCIEGSVGLSHLDLRGCKQLEEILRLPLNIRNVDARGCSSLKSFLPESNNNLSCLWTLNLSGSGIVSLPPCIEGSVMLFKLDLRDCKQLEEILRLPLNIREVDARGCRSLEHFAHVSTESSFGIPDLKWLSTIDLSECNKVHVDVGNHAPDPLLVQERFWTKPSSTIIYPGSRIPEWFKYCKETTSYTNSIEIEIDHNASMCFGHQIVALVLCSVVGPLTKSKPIIIKINDQCIRDYDLSSSTDPHRIWLKYIAEKSIDKMLSRSYMEGNHMRFTFGSDSEEAILKSAGVHLIYGNDNFIDLIQL